MFSCNQENDVFFKFKLVLISIRETIIMEDIKRIAIRLFDILLKRFQLLAKTTDVFQGVKPPGRKALRYYTTLQNTPLVIISKAFIRLINDVRQPPNPLLLCPYNYGTLPVGWLFTTGRARGKQFYSLNTE